MSVQFIDRIKSEPVLRNITLSINYEWHFNFKVRSQAIYCRYPGLNFETRPTIPYPQSKRISMRHR